MAHLLPPAFGADLPRATVGEGVQSHARPASLPDELDLSKVKPILMFALQLAVSATVAAGTILALFAWTQSGLIMKDVFAI